jgi:hypothetical protein
MPVNRFDRTAYGESEGDPSNQGDADDFANHGPEAVRRLRAQLEELGDYARLYFSARKDALLAQLRKAALWVLAGVAAFSVLCAMLITATVMALLGLAQVIGVGLGDRLWAGYLIVGFGLLLIAATSLAFSIRYVQRRFHQQTVKKYAQRHQAQRTRHGNHVPASSQAERN